jgi:GT2 family glycosyltransferase
VSAAAGPDVSVVIPTVGRPAALARTLAALARQTAAERFEVVVVSDGGGARTHAAATFAPAAFSLRVIEQDRRGAAAARNRGAAAARAEILLFLDDDVVPEPPCVAAHRAAHEELGERVVIGPYWPVHAPETGLFRIAVRNWWEEEFARIGRPGHRFGYRDLLSGNLSMPKSLFRRAGGFDSRFPNCGCEDWELGVRLVALGVPFRFEPAAAAIHHERETMTLRRSLERARIEGGGTARIESLHPELGRAAEPARHRLDSALRFAARRLPRIGDALVQGLRPGVELLDAMRLRGAWRAAYGAVRHYCFWRGYFEALAEQAAAGGDRAGEPDPVRWLGVDLAEGLETAETAIDRERPHGVRISLRGREVARLDPVPGAERLRGAHLRARVAALVADAAGGPDSP